MLSMSACHGQDTRYVDMALGDEGTMEHLKKEAIRYLGYGKHAVDEETLRLIAESFDDLQRTAQRKSIYRIFALSNGGDERANAQVGFGEDSSGQEAASANRIIIGNMEIESRNLAKNLRGCEEAVLFGATLGIGVDRLISRTGLTNMAKAVVLQACAAAYLEEYCDVCQEQIAEEMKKEGKYLRPRFSPGYGDFSLSHQNQLMQMLDCAKKIGLTMTESCLMTPTKSVTAVIGVSTTMIPCHRSGCEACQKVDCAYRR